VSTKQIENQLHPFPQKEKKIQNKTITKIFALVTSATTTTTTTSKSTTTMTSATK
jgi:hypothetical protein